MAGVGGLLGQDGTGTNKLFAGGGGKGGTQTSGGAAGLGGTQRQLLRQSRDAWRRRRSGGFRRVAMAEAKAAGAVEVSTGAEAEAQAAHMKGLP